MGIIKRSAKYSGKCILIVDDEPDIAKMISECLENQGAVVYIAINGKEGIESASLHHPDLIILDVMMPGIDGTGVYESVRNNPELKNTAIIFLTGDIDMITYLKETEFPSHLYFSKPFSIAEMVQSIDMELLTQKS